MNIHLVNKTTLSNEYCKYLLSCEILNKFKYDLLGSILKFRDYFDIFISFEKVDREYDIYIEYSCNFEMVKFSERIINKVRK